MPAFNPLLGEAPEILILGSMPGRRSLSESRYYAHPQNCFWWIMSHIIGFEEGLGYQQKCKNLIDANFGLWDVLFDCDRLGSLDSNIRRSSEQTNDFSIFLDGFPSIRLIAFNGQTAKKIFMRYWQSLVEKNKHISWCLLPSSSPAYASISREEKLAAWQKSLT